MRIEHRGLKIFALAVFTAGCLGIFFWLYTEAGGTLPWSNPYHLTVEVPNAYELVSNADVREAGVKIGTVSGIDSVGNEAKISVDISRQYAPIYRDAQALIRTKTLVGENYLELTPGHRSAGVIRDGGSLAPTQAQEAVQVDQILNAFDPRTRAAVRRDLDALGPGLAGRGNDLNELFGNLDPTVQNGQAVLSVLNQQRQQVAQVVDKTGAVMQALGNRTQALQQLATDAKATAVAAASRDQALGAALDQLGPTLSQAQESVARLASFANGATPVISNLRVATADLRPVVQDLGPAAVQGQRLFAVLPPFLQRANPLLKDLRSFSNQTVPAVLALNAFLGKLNPALAYLSPFAREFGVVLPDVGSAVGVTDAVGHVGRVHAEIDANSLEGLTPADNLLLKALIQAGGLSKWLNNGNNPFPQPGTVENPGTSSAYRSLQPSPSFG